MLAAAPTATSRTKNDPRSNRDHQREIELEKSTSQSGNWQTQRTQKLRGGCQNLRQTGKSLGILGWIPTGKREDSPLGQSGAIGRSSLLLRTH